MLVGDVILAVKDVRPQAFVVSIPVFPLSTLIIFAPFKTQEKS
jgi:hypothetical protein